MDSLAKNRPKKVQPAAMKLHLSQPCCRFDFAFMASFSLDRKFAKQKARSKAGLLESNSFGHQLNRLAELNEECCGMLLDNYSIRFPALRLSYKTARHSGVG